MKFRRTSSADVGNPCVGNADIKTGMSVNPSQSLSLPSFGWSISFWPSGVQHAVLEPPTPIDTTEQHEPMPTQSGSAQSNLPSQSSSRPSPQVVGLFSAPLG